MKNRIKAPVLAVAVTFGLSGCGLLDVDNPNSLVEASIQQQAAANGVVNGSLRLVADAVASVWEGPAVVADELYWTGSRDAWGQLDNGFIGDPLNEFTDGAFPNLGEAVWMAQNAVTILDGHVAEGGADFAYDAARAHMYNGIILMITGEIQDDMTFSNKQEDGPPVGPASMNTVLDRAIAELDMAVTGFTGTGDSDEATVARAIRARAHHSRAIWDVLNPSATAGGAMAFAAALADANAVIAAVGGTDWQYNMVYTSASSACGMCSNVNNRGENQIDDSLVENDGPGASGRTGVVVLNDPVSGVADLAVTRAMTQWGDDQYAELTIVSERLMRLIVAEDALAGGGVAAFEAQIDAIRALDGEVEFNSGGAVSDMDMLRHTRRVNTLFQGLRLQDMYRWGITDARWQNGSQALGNAGEMLPITIVEVRANCHLNGQGCSG